MVQSVKIENFKSISKLEFELGRFNVFIGENGSGKSNLLEAFAMAAAAQQIQILPESLYAKGIRVTRPSLTYNALNVAVPQDNVYIKLEIDTGENPIRKFETKLTAANPNQIEAAWTNVILQQNLSKTHEIANQLATIKERIKQIEAENSDKGKRAALFIDVSKQIAEIQEENVKLAPAMLGLEARNFLNDFVIFALNIPSLRGIFKDSLTQPLGIHGENLDVHIHQLSGEVREELRNFYKYISWLGDVEVDVEDRHKTEGYKLGKSTSQLYFIDRFLKEANNLMSAESANEGVLFLLFYLVLFLSPQTPRFFAIDNIEQALNPRLARVLITELARLAKEKNKQALITTHDPAILDGLNLYDDEQRLFVVSRADDGATTVNRVKLNGEAKREFKLSEMWMRGSLGAVPTTF